MYPIPRKYITLNQTLLMTVKTLTFRFFCIFFPLYFFLEFNGTLPFTDDLSDWSVQPFHHLIPWLAQPFLHKPVTVFTNGSGDTTYDYLVVAFTFLLSLIGCTSWSILDRHRQHYPRLQYWLTALVRYYLAFTMLNYGMVKVIKLQFPFPGIHRLLEPYGESSPMGLAWTFMGYSRGYNYFAGFAEVLSGLLLLNRRTTTFGALVACTVSANIMAMTSLNACSSPTHSSDSSTATSAQ